MAVCACSAGIDMTQDDLKFEPVAWMDDDGKTFPFVWNVSSVQQGSKYLDETLTPLYTHPPRTWVGLTDEELEVLFQTAAGADEEVHIRFARAIESKIKKLNT